ncbi:hypothetical protein EKG38_03425 [Shewanella canadensis]|uniref:HTH psq-type domain-containing protein n=1 Tax=Shewanella canadensis TaxID=271096 RepID=A0A431X0J1_9GAMM|nr:hypothetical protein [Shewanella canadensis]RTR40973.1 hypothetical protein EKG38_03425 [Shewanella canadensis]
MTEAQLKLIADYLEMDLSKVQAAHEVVENGATKYAAEKKFGVPPNTLGRHVTKYKTCMKFFDALCATY